MRICKIESEKRRLTVPAEFGFVFDGAKYALLVRDCAQPRFTVYPLTDNGTYGEREAEFFDYNIGATSMTGQERRAFLGAQSETVKLKRGNGAGLRLIVPQPFLDHAGVRTAVCCVQQPYGMDVWNQEKYEEYVSGLRVKCH